MARIYLDETTDSVKELQTYEDRVAVAQAISELQELFLRLEELRVWVVGKGKRNSAPKIKIEGAEKAVYEEEAVPPIACYRSSQSTSHSLPSPVQYGVLQIDLLVKEVVRFLTGLKHHQLQFQEQLGSEHNDMY